MSEKTCLTYDEISEAIANGNTKQVKEMFEGFHVLKGKGASTRVTASSLKLINIMLRIAAVKTWEQELKDDMANVLIEYISPIINIFGFIYSLVDQSSVVDFDEIPKEIRDSLRKNAYTKKIGEQIMALDKDTFDKMLRYLITKEEVECLNLKFSLPIAQYCFVNEIIPRNAFFSYMGNCLNESREYHAFADFMGDLIGIS